MVTAHLKVLISNVKKVTGIRTSKYNVYQLTSSEVAQQYRQKTEESLNYITLTEKDNGEKLWERCKTIINSMTDEVLGIMGPTKELGLMLHARLLPKIKKSIQEDATRISYQKLNLLKTKRNLLYIINQSVPRSKHFPPRL